MTIQIKHSFPELGCVSFPLHRESAELFDAFEKTKNCGTRHLEKLDQLGELRYVMHCGHHSRYEYLIFQMYLIHRFKEANAYGLSSSVELDGLRISSGEELLKCWALISENSHLHGTYEIERFWLKLFCTRSDFREMLLHSVKHPLAKAEAERILKSQSLFSFYKILAWIFLKRAEKQNGQDIKRQQVFKNAQVMLLASYEAGTEGKKIHSFKRAFSKIRRLSYLYLDLARMPTQLNFNPSILIQRIGSNPKDYLEENEGHFPKLSDALQEMLFDQIYASPLASSYKLERMRNLEEHLNKRLKINPRYIIANQSQFEGALQGAKSGPLVPMKGSIQHWYPYARLKFLPNEIISNFPVKIFDAEEKLQKTIKSLHWGIFITPYKTQYGNGAIVDVFEDMRFEENREGWLIAALLEHIQDCYLEWKGMGAPYLWLLQEPLTTLFLSCITRYLNENLQARILPETTIGDNKVIFLKNKNIRRKWSKQMAWEQRRSKLSAERKWEFECFRSQIRKTQRGVLLVCSSNIAIEDKSSNRRIAEIDGVFIRILKNSVDLVLIEAKSGHSDSTTTAASQLSECLLKLGANDKQANAFIVNEQGYSVATIPLKIGRSWSKTKPQSAS